jgi:hypothetical protein
MSRPSVAVGLNPRGAKPRSPDAHARRRKLPAPPYSPPKRGGPLRQTQRHRRSERASRSTREGRKQYRQRRSRRPSR